MVAQPLSTEEVRAYLNKNVDRHLSNKVLHAHPSPAYWATEIEDTALQESLSHYPGVHDRINLYMGIPYCLPTDPPHCGFCLFPTERYAGKDTATAYLGVMAKEAELYRGVYEEAVIESLYVGGGTPNLLHPSDYQTLIDIAQRLFPHMDPAIEKTIEGIPQLFNEDKIRAIKDAGFNRVSMGVQQVDDRLIQYSGRKQTRKQVFDAIEAFHRHDLACNIDLIYGWPDQTIDDMLAGLRDIVETGIRHITHYELNIAGRSDFATKQKAKVPSIAEKLVMFEEAGSYLRSEGFVQDTVYDWSKPTDVRTSAGVSAAEYRFEDNLRHHREGDTCRYMGGLGYAAVNIRLAGARSASLMNHRGLDRYADEINAGHFPVERAFFHNEEDVRLCWIFQQLQTMRLDTVAYHQHFGRSLFVDYPHVIEELLFVGWAEVTPEGVLELVSVGPFFVPLIQGLFSQARLNQMAQPRKTIPITAH